MELKQLQTLAAIRETIINMPSNILTKDLLETNTMLSENETITTEC